MNKLLLTVSMVFGVVVSAGPAFADCIETAKDAAVSIGKLPKVEGDRRFVQIFSSNITTSDIGTNTYSVDLQIDTDKREVFEVTLNRRSCLVSSVVRRY